jgi:hypothetical protein
VLVIVGVGVGLIDAVGVFVDISVGSTTIVLVGDGAGDPLDIAMHPDNVRTTPIIHIIDSVFTDLILPAISLL